MVVDDPAADRTQRPGQLTNVFVYKRVVSCSIEAKLLVAQEPKTWLVADILSEGAQYDQVQRGGPGRRRHYPAKSRLSRIDAGLTHADD